MFGVKVERQKMLFIKRIVILDLHETIGRFHWCWSLEWKESFLNGKYLIHHLCLHLLYVCVSLFIIQPQNDLNKT